MKIFIIFALLLIAALSQPNVSFGQKSKAIVLCGSVSSRAYFLPKPQVKFRHRDDEIFGNNLLSINVIFELNEKGVIQKITIGKIIPDWLNNTILEAAERSKFTAYSQGCTLHKSVKKLDYIFIKLEESDKIVVSIKEYF